MFDSARSSDPLYILPIASCATFISLAELGNEDDDDDDAELLQPTFGTKGKDRRDDYNGDEDDDDDELLQPTFGTKGKERRDDDDDDDELLQPVFDTKGRDGQDHDKNNQEAGAVQRCNRIRVALVFVWHCAAFASSTRDTCVTGAKCNLSVQFVSVQDSSLSRSIHAYIAGMQCRTLNSKHFKKNTAFDIIVVN